MINDCFLFNSSLCPQGDLKMSVIETLGDEQSLPVSFHH